MQKWRKNEVGDGSEGLKQSLNLCKGGERGWH